MLRTHWTLFRRAAFYGAAILTAAGLANGQELPLSIPNTPITIFPDTKPALSLPIVAPTAPSAASTVDELKARVERLEKQNQDLLNAMKAVQNRQA